MQRRKIAQACLRSGYGDITVGTAEAFQGQEKAVIIVSTVRSGGTRLGFVNNARVSDHCPFELFWFFLIYHSIE